MSDGAIHDKIDELVQEQHRLRDQIGTGEISSAQGQQRLTSIQTELDRLWDLLRQQEAKQEFPDSEADPHERSASTVEGYLD